VIATSEHDEVAEFLGAYALDALENDEIQRVEHHLAECPTCRDEADQLFAVAATFGADSALEGGEPPAHLWERIAADTRSADLGASGLAPKSIRSGRASVVTPIDSNRGRGVGRRRAWSAALAATAAAAVIIALAVGLVHTQGQVHRLQSALALRGTDAAVSAALDTPGAQVVTLQAPAGSDLARVVVEPSGVGYVVASTMSALPAAETYQLWMAIDGRAISVGLLGPQPRTGGAFNLGSAVRNARELMVTVEPATGVVTPTHTPIATAALRLT